MNDAKYIGLDVHQATISAAVFDSDGRLIMESIRARNKPAFDSAVYSQRASRKHP